MNTLTKEDFDLTIEYNFFDVFYSISILVEHNEIKEWCVAGWELENGSDQRNVNTVLYTHPISVYVRQVEKTTLRDLKRTCIVGTSKEEIIEQKKKLVDTYFQEILNKLK